MKCFSGEYREEVWLKALSHLTSLSDETEFNLIMEITNPCASSDRSKEIRQKLDVLLANANVYSCHGVAETIFPMTEYKKSGLPGVIETYPNETFPQIKRFPGNGKGTYAFRIVRGVDAKGKECRPLEDVLARLASQIKNSGVRCAYEIPIDGAESIPINCNDRSLMGFPCLSHLSFKLSMDRSELHLTALYRSQDYVQKAVGNLLGLARLQAVMARELKIRPGSLVCHSTYAMYEKTKGIGKRTVGNLINELEGVANGSSQVSERG